MDIVGIIRIGKQRDFSSIACNNVKYIEVIDDLNDSYRQYNYISVDNFMLVKNLSYVHHFDFIETLNNLTEDDSLYLSDLRYELKEKKGEYLVFMRRILRTELRRFPIILHIKEGYGHQMFQYWIAKYLADKLHRPLVVTAQYPFLLSKDTFPNLGDIAMTINYPDPDNILRCSLFEFDYIDHVLQNSKNYEQRHIVIDTLSTSYELIKSYEFYIKKLYKLNKPLYTMDRIVIHIRLGDLLSENIKVQNFPEYCIKTIQQIHKSIGMIQVLLLSENPEHPYTKNIMEKICKNGIDINLLPKESIEADFDKIYESSHVILTNSTWTWWAAFLNPCKQVYVAISSKQGGKIKNNPLFIKSSPENFEIFDLDNFKPIHSVPRFNKPRLAICVIRYDEDLQWLVQYTSYADVYVYNKGRPLNYGGFKEIHVENVDLVHLKHIVENYDNLHDITFFTQANIDNYGYDHDSIKGMFFDHEFVKHSGTSHNICRWPVSVKDFCIKPGYTMKDFWMKYIAPNATENPMLFKWYKNNIFSATKNVISKRSKEYYASVYDDILHNSEKVQYLERSWYYILHNEWQNKEYTKQLGKFFVTFVKNNGFNLITEEMDVQLGLYKTQITQQTQTQVDPLKKSRSKLL